MIRLRDYQQDVDDAVCRAWRAGSRNILGVMPTGAGKTVTFGHRIHQETQSPGICVAIAHRQELVSQISLALARESVAHRIVGASHLPRTCTSLHLQEMKRTWVNPRANCVVAGVDTLIKRKEPWFGQVKLWVMDEAHHVLRDNKWGKAIDLFPNARGLGVTATPQRADGNGLGRHADGVFDEMILGPTMGELIERGHLSRYRVFAPPAPSLDLSAVPIGAAGDFVPRRVADAVHKSHIHGDAVEHYLKLARGRLGVTFAVDVESAQQVAEAYRKAGVPAEVVSAKTPDLLRASTLRRFRNRELLQLVNVDLFGEGFDLPAIEVVTMLRPTASFPVFAQQFGRALRTMEGKDHALILDHVGNTIRHGLPDAPREWTLDRRDRRSRGTKTTIPVRACPECLAVYERFHVDCPFCGYRPAPMARSAPDQVDGDLVELDPQVMSAINSEIAKIDGEPRIPLDASPMVAAAIKKRHRERQEAQAALRERMSLWGGRMTATGMELREAQRLFYLTFGIDVATAQTLGRGDAEELAGRITI